jgi:hypothetical protein
MDNVVRVEAAPVTGSQRAKALVVALLCVLYLLNLSSGVDRGPGLHAYYRQPGDGCRSCYVAQESSRLEGRFRKRHRWPVRIPTIARGSRPGNRQSAGLCAGCRK